MLISEVKNQKPNVLGDREAGILLFLCCGASEILVWGQLLAAKLGLETVISI